ncbi:MAG: hypothetical protein U0U66_01445 [Cytophagaceae bacterium]
MYSLIAFVLIILGVIALIAGLVLVVIGLIKNQKTRALWGAIIAVTGVATYLLTTQWIWQKEGNTIAFHQLTGVYVVEKISPEWGLDSSVVRTNVLELTKEGTYSLKDTTGLGIANMGYWTYDKEALGKELCFSWEGGEKCIFMNKKDLDTRIVFYKELEKAPTHLIWVKE